MAARVNGCDWRGVVLLAVSAVLTGACGVTSTAQPDPEREPAERAAVEGGLSVSRYGMYAEFRIAFAEERSILGGSVRSGGLRSEASFAPRFGPDEDELPPLPLRVPPRKPVLASGSVFPGCGDAPVGSIPEIEVRTRLADGTEDTERFVMDDEASWADAVKAWCASGPRLGAKGTTRWPDGSYEIAVEVHNPGPDEVRLEAAQGRAGGGTWEHDGFTLRPRASADLVIRGRAAPCEPGPSPATRVTIDIEGKPYRFSTEVC